MIGTLFTRAVMAPQHAGQMIQRQYQLDVHHLQTAPTRQGLSAPYPAAGPGALVAGEEGREEKGKSGEMRRGEE